MLGVIKTNCDVAPRSATSRPKATSTAISKIAPAMPPTPSSRPLGCNFRRIRGLLPIPCEPSRASPGLRCRFIPFQRKPSRNLNATAQVGIRSKGEVPKIPAFRTHSAKFRIEGSALLIWTLDADFYQVDGVHPWDRAGRRSARSLSCSGSGDRVGCFQSQVVGVGPQIGFLFPVGDMQGYLNLKAYGEFAAENRPSGWNAWVTFAISPPAPGVPPTTKPIVRKY